ncbi:hypothetical protein CFP65_1408 [Kitasatospora sp. MMS16-BH015]|uniref:GTPase-associated protein 1-related protein n=1 Tax=Kitasatospora sp. MMS16-BH015 TaxID=2018025 RepID=UPI000CA15750|nr:GTPase-associated protein 1-related protein [Kitasatospora sp. MMS16-BH015]AUG76307.1 hypothetical protein CFP65_1408 [Kitasatospora sp. MMS16-BH015]
MAFQQLYYTSCEHGLSGFAGYQFNAVSPETSAETMRLVEALTAYEPPRSLLGAQTPEELARCPVNLVHVPGSPALSAQVRYVGRDSSRRVGNYFAHALGSPDFARDAGGLLGIELWGSAAWSSTPATGTRLPELGAVPAGPLSPSVVGLFLRQHPHAELLGALLAATLDALAHERTVLLVERDSASVAHWVAAVCYLLPPPLARRLSFATYQHRPERARLHLVGTVPEIRLDLGAEHQDAFHLLDFVQGRVPPLPDHPLVGLLTRIGLRAASAFWARTGVHLRGDEQTAQDWHGPAAATAAAAAIRLTEADVAAVTDWLRQSPGPPSGAVTTVLQDLYRHQRLTRPQLTELIPLARAHGQTELAALMTGQVVEHDLLAIRDDTARHPAPVRITDPEERVRTTARWLATFETAHGAAALRLLAWAAGAGLEPSERQLAPHSTRIAEQLLATAVTDSSLTALAAELTAAAQRWPGFRAGVVEAVLRLEGDRPGQFRAVLAELPAGLIDADDLTGRPELLEDFLAVQVERHRTTAHGALVRILEANGTGVLDGRLLRVLWPHGPGRWTLTEARLLLPELLPAKLPGLHWTDGALGWLAATVCQEIPDKYQWEEYTRVASLLRRLPTADRLPADARSCLARTLELAELVQNAVDADSLALLLDDPPPEHWHSARSVLNAQLPRLLIERPVRDPAATGPRLSKLEEPTALAYLDRLDREAKRVGRHHPANRYLIEHLVTLTRTRLPKRELLAGIAEHWPEADLDRLRRALEPVDPAWAERIAYLLAQRPVPLRRRVAGRLKLRRGGAEKTEE